MIEVGFVGLGHMGKGMARTLLRAGHRLTVWNRTRAHAEELAADGAIVANTPAETAHAGIVITMLSDDRAVEAVVFGPNGILAGLPRGGVHVSMSTIGVETAERLARHHEEASRQLVSAPVFGRPDAAAAAKLSIVVAGREHAVAAVLPLLHAMGQRVFALGEDPPRANLVKLAGNFLITAAIEAMAEGIAVVAKGGVDRGQFLDVVLGSLFDAPVYRGYAKILLEERFSPPGFALPLGLKDNRLLLDAGEKLAAPLPLASLIHDRMVAALARGYGDQDWSAFARISAEEAGIADGRGQARTG